jgi:hypothetical protein
MRKRMRKTERSIGGILKCDEHLSLLLIGSFSGSLLGEGWDFGYQRFSEWNRGWYGQELWTGYYMANTANFLQIVLYFVGHLWKGTRRRMNVEREW